jgi:hypothetical protein
MAAQTRRDFEMDDTNIKIGEIRDDMIDDILEGILGESTAADSKRDMEMLPWLFSDQPEQPPSGRTS